VSLTSPQTPIHRRDAERIVALAVETGRLERRPAERLAGGIRDPQVLEPILEGASESKRRGKGDVVSVSKNVFIPLTNLCRDRCAYCTFAVQPDSPEAKTYTLDEVAGAVRDGVRAGCTEALFCLGDKPELAYRTHRSWLAERGLGTTAEYLVQACRVGFENGMLPHTNAGILDAEEMTALRRFNASMGLMLESTSERLRGKGMAHYYARAASCSGSARTTRSASTPCWRSAISPIATVTSRRPSSSPSIRSRTRPCATSARWAMRRSRAGSRWPDSCSGPT
jgi:FO synthase